jgi:hypothetical protein
LDACKNDEDCGGERKGRLYCRPTPPHEKQSNVRIDNQFGTIFVTTLISELLLVPSSKSLDGPAPLLPEDIDHYKCYKVKEIRNICEIDPSIRCRNDSDFPSGICNKGLEKNLNVVLFDQFLHKEGLFNTIKQTLYTSKKDRQWPGNSDYES